MKKRNWKIDKHHKEKQKRAWFDMLEEIKKLVETDSKTPLKRNKS